MAIDSNEEYQRPKEGFRFKFGGLKTNAVADSLPPDKYAMAINVRAVLDSSIRGRWGLAPQFPTEASPVTDIRAYTALGTDNTPRFLAATAHQVLLNTVTHIYLGQPGNTSTQVAALAGVGNGVGIQGVTMIPFRPAQSPNPWMYVANGYDYQKLSAPGAADAVTQQNVGIAEPQIAPDAAGQAVSFNAEPSSFGSFAHAGTAGAITGGTRVSDTVQSVFPDPGVASGYPTIGVSTGKAYAKQMQLTINGNGALVQDVFPGQPSAIAISSIYYFTGSTGRCVIVPANLGSGPGVNGQSIYTQNLLNSIRRGALIKFSSGPETCYVWSVVEGPDGSVCIETSTTGTHTAAETITVPPALQVYCGAAISAAQAISSIDGSFSITTGVGTQTLSGLSGLFNFGTFAFQQDDYIQLSINISALANFTEAKLMFDVGDGSFTQNFYYYTVRVSDVEAGIQNTLTQLGAAQLVDQRATIDEESAAASGNQLATSSSAQTTPGDAQWAEIIFPISALTRVGNDQTLSLPNTNAIQWLFNMSGSATVLIGVMTIFGGGSPDVGDSGAPYLYRVRPRSSLTGVLGNPSPATRYGVNPRRAPVLLSLPSAAYDAQIDTWDIFRYGGSVTSWRKIGQCASSASTFSDNYTDEAALAGDPLDFDNLEPWPTLDLPLQATATSVTGFTALVTVPSAALATRYLPGNFVRLGGINVYTLRQRPTVISGTTFRFEFLENAGAATNLPCQIYEPQTARQRLPYMWGPDSEGTVFAVGDPLRPGTLYFAKNYAPDSAPSEYNIEITPPSEPLFGGEVLDGLSFVASPKRWWALYPQPSNPTQRYSVIQQPLPRGLAAPFGHCTDGKTLYWWAEDGIWSSSAGSLTDDDLYNLFPHDGVPGTNYTYNGNTVFAPDYAQCSTFRLAIHNNYLYAKYQDSSGTPRTLTLDVRRGAWVVDHVVGFSPTTYYTPEQPEGGVLANLVDYPTFVVGCSNGNVYTESDNTNDDTQAIQCTVATMEWDGGDVRAGWQWGDMWLDCTPNAGGSVPALTVQPTSFGAPAPGVVATTIPRQTTRIQTQISLGGEVTTDFLGMQIDWTDNYLTSQTAATLLQIWQPSFLPKPELIVDRDTDWYDGGTEKAKFIQGFLLHADTGNVAKQLGVRDSDSLTLHSFTPFVIHNGESIIAYSFSTPFVAHQVRLEPGADGVQWRFFDIDWIFEATPEQAQQWQTQATSFGMNGYSHIQRIVAAYTSSANILLTITAFDGTSPALVVLPPTGGLYQKLLQTLTFNKGQLYQFTATSAAPFQLFLDDWEILVGNWGRSGAYLTWKSLGGKHGVQAEI